VAPQQGAQTRATAEESPWRHESSEAGGGTDEGRGITTKLMLELAVAAPLATSAPEAPDSNAALVAKKATICEGRRREMFEAAEDAFRSPLSRQRQRACEDGGRAIRGQLQDEFTHLAEEIGALGGTS
jgi:hypothetical protein